MVIKNIEMPKRCAECEFCINKRTNDYGFFGECFLLKGKKVNCLANGRDDNCFLSNVKIIDSD